MFKKLDPLLHSELRLAVMSLLMNVLEADFTFIMKKTNSTSGNLSIQIDKLHKAKYIDVKKEFKDNKPKTTCFITEKGKEAFEEYVNVLTDYIKLNREDL